MFFSIFVTRWFNFEKAVQALIAEKVHYLNLEQLQGIIQKVCFIEDEDEVATLLDFYHDLGMIVRQRNTVVLRAQWLIEVIRQLITIRSFNEMVSQVYKCIMLVRYLKLFIASQTIMGLYFRGPPLLVL